jgi:hypothetical protein
LEKHLVEDVLLKATCFLFPYFSKSNKKHYKAGCKASTQENASGTRHFIRLVCS